VFFFLLVSIKRIKRIVWMILNTWKNLWRCKNYIKFNKAKNFNFHVNSKNFASFFGILIDFVLIILRDDTVPKKFLYRNTKHEIASDLSSYKNNLQIFLSLDIYILFFMSCIMKGVLIFYQFFFAARSSFGMGIK